MAADCSIDQLNKYEETETAMLETSVRMYARLGSPLTHSPTTMRNAHEWLISNNYQSSTACTDSRSKRFRKKERKNIAFRSIG